MNLELQAEEHVELHRLDLLFCDVGTSQQDELLYLWVEVFLVLGRDDESRDADQLNLVNAHAELRKVAIYEVDRKV